MVKKGKKRAKKDNSFNKGMKNRLMFAFVVFMVIFSLLIGNLLNMNVSPSMGAIIIAFGVSVGIGVMFGFLPARKAARLNPIDALRNE